MAKGHGFKTRLRCVAAAAAMLLVQPLPATAQDARSLTRQDLLVVARALPFLMPPLSGDVQVAVVFAPGSEASRDAAERIVGLFGSGLRSGTATLHARAVAADALGGGGHALLIAAAGAPGARIMAAAKAQKVACVTTMIEQVEAGQCALWVRSTPRIDVVVSRAAIEDTGLGFAAAFRLMVREL